MKTTGLRQEQLTVDLVLLKRTTMTNGQKLCLHIEEYCVSREGQDFSTIGF